jgi:hypothetical protein
MSALPERGPSSSVRWEFADEWTAGRLATTTWRGSRIVDRVSRFWGSCYLRPNGLLAGFSIDLVLAGRQDRTLRWEAIDPEHVNARDFRGPCVLTTSRRTFFSRVTGKLIPMALPGSDLYHFKLMLATGYRGVQLNWPSSRLFFNRLELSFSTEIRQRPAAG